jgi:DNA polymerase-3 subunit gamma/tau
MCSLTNRYRPHTFDHLVGQRVAQLVLHQMVRKNAVPPALLLSGPPGSGKTSSARILGASLVCDLSPEPCGTCGACREVFAGTSLDVLELDGATHGLVADIRAVCESVQYTLSGRHRIVVLDEAQSLSREAFNALLTTLERPPEGVVFVLVTTEPRKLPDTILSRCMQIEFRRIALGDIVGRLETVCRAENLEVESTLLRVIADRADGGLRDAIMLLDQVTSVGVRTAEQFSELMGETDYAPTLLEGLLTGRAADAFAVTDEQLCRTGDPQEVVTCLVHCLRDVVTLHAEGELTHQGSALAARQRLARLLPAERALAALRVFWDVQTKVHTGDDRRTALELAVAVLADVLGPPVEPHRPRHLPEPVAAASVPGASAPAVPAPSKPLTLAEIAALGGSPLR